MLNQLDRRKFLAVVGGGVLGTAMGATGASARHSTSAVTSSSDEISWNRYYGNDGFTRAVDADVGPEDGIEIDWENQNFDRPAVLYKDGELLVTDEDGSIYLLDADTGEQEHIHTMSGWAFAGHWVDDLYFFADTEGTIGAIDVAERAPKWTRTLSIRSWPPLYSSGTVYVGGTGELIEVDPETGVTVDSVTIPTSSRNSVAGFVSDGADRLYVGHHGPDTPGVFAVESQSMTVDWYTTETAPPEPMVDSRGLVSTGLRSGNLLLCSIDPDTGTKHWQIVYGFDVAESIVTGLGPDRIFVSGEDQLMAVDRADGRVDWVSDHDVLSFVLAGDTLYAGLTDSSELVAIDRRTGDEKWRNYTVSIDAVAAFGPTRMFVPYDGSIYAVKGRNFSANTEFRVTSLDPDDETFGEDETMEFSATIENVSEFEDPRTVALEIGSIEVHSMELELESGETQTITFGEVNAAFLGPGEYEMEVRAGDDSETGTVTILEPAELVVADLTPVEEPVAPEERIAVQAAVENEGEATATAELELTIDDESIDETYLEIEGNERTSVEFEFTAPATPGEYTYEVSAEDDSADGRLTVEEPEDDPVDDVEVPGFGIGAAVTGLGGAGYALKRRFGEDADQ